MTKGYWVPGFENRKVVVHHILRLPEWLKVGVSFQQEASGRHYINRSECRPDTQVQGEWMTRLDGTIGYYGEDIRRGMIGVDEHKRRFMAANPAVTILGRAGAGNITMNPFYLAWARGYLGYTDADLPNLQSDYAFDGLVVHEDWHVEYHNDIRFRWGQDTAMGIPILLAGADASARVRFAIIGPTIVLDGKAISEAELQQQVARGEHYDLRHVMLFPHVRWNERKECEPPQDPAAVISFCPLLETMWTNADLNRGVIGDVFDGNPIKASTEPYDNPELEYVKQIGRRIGTQTVIDALVGRGYVPVDHAPSATGEFRLCGPKSGEGYQTIEARIRPGIYNFSALGVTDAQEVIWGCTTGLGGRVGITVCQMGQLLAEAGCQYAVLLDQGGDVSLTLGDRQVVQSSYGRDKMRGILLFVDPKRQHEPADVELPWAATLAMRPIKRLRSWQG